MHSNVSRSKRIFRCVMISVIALAAFAGIVAYGQTATSTSHSPLKKADTAMDARPPMDYYAPLQKWLDEQNVGHTAGWN